MGDDDYRAALKADGRDLIALAEQGSLEPVLFREQEVAALLEALDRGQSVLVTGPAGVGKTAVLRGAALEMARRRSGGLIELSTVALLSGTRYLGEWQSKLTAIARAAMKGPATLVISDIANLATAGVTSKNESSMLDALRPLIESRKLVIVGEVTADKMRVIERHPGFGDLFRKLPVAPLEESRVDAILERAAQRAGIDVDAAGRRTLVQLTSRFLPARPQPGPALGLLEQVRHYRQEKEHVGEDAPVTPAFIERVFSIYSGLPPFVVSREATMSGADMRAWFRERLVGQEAAINAAVESIALFKAGLHDPAKPLGTFLFVGPTGVGKTELARALATFLFGSPMRMLRFDLSELKDYHSFQLLVGDPKAPDQPAALIDPVRAQPFQVVLLDELEKAHANVWDLLLPVLDEGRLTPPFGETVDFRSTLVICTSNIGAHEAQQRAVGFGDERGDSEARVREALEAHFRPELLNRFQHIVVFHPLTRREVRQVARKELARILQREGVVSRHLAVDVDEEALDAVIERGFDPKYGARALKREIQSQLVLPIAMTLMEKPVEPGQIVKVGVRHGRVHVQLIDTAGSRESRRESEPVRSAGRRWTRDELNRSFTTLRERIENLARRLDEDTMKEEQTRLSTLRASPSFWRSADEAARTLRELDYVTHAIERVGSLRGEVETLLEQSRRAQARSVLSPLVQQEVRLESAVALAELELVQMGREGRWDALIEIRPLGSGGKLARDSLVTVYGEWARSRPFQVDVLREPLDGDEPALLALSGNYAFGLLRSESGLHRFALPKTNSVARVRVAAWTDRKAPVGFLDQVALKRAGTYGGKVRSRVECAGGLVLQNGRTLAENRELALGLAGSWREAPAPEDDLVRRYEPETPLVRDVLTDTNSGHPDALKPERFHQLLCERVKVLWTLREEPPPAA